MFGISVAQDNLGSNTGNYAGVTGISLQPASIADSRYKFDFNIASASVNFSNNYLGFSRSYFLKNRFSFSDFRNYNDFKSKVLIENNLNGERANFQLNNRLQLPLSFMMSLGKKSGLGLNVQNRTSIAFNNVNADFAKQVYDFWGNKATYGKNYDVSGMKMNAMNWMEVGLTYGRVVLDRNKHFLKFGVTAKYLGGLSSWNLDAKQLTVRASQDSLFTASGNVNFNHSESNISSKINTSYRPDASSWGGDLGVVYEFRGRINKYLVPKYNKRDDYTESVARRDKNKYSVKLGVSLLDVGVLNFKSAPLARNFKIDVGNFNLAAIDVRNIRQFDTLIANNVTYTSPAGEQYSVAMPTALSAQLDLHVIKGFYVNAMHYRPFNGLNKNTTYRIVSPNYYAVTPRWENRWAGVYLPFSINSVKEVSAGATVRLGPLFVGTSNLLTLAKKENIQQADVHAGLKVPIAFGKPSKASKLFKKFTNKKEDTIVYEKTIQENNTIIKTEEKEIRIQDNKKSKEAASPQPIQIIINNYNSPNLNGGNTGSKVYNVKTGDSNQTIQIEENNIDTKELNDLQQQIEYLQLKLMQKEQLLNELEKSKSNGTNSSESKKKIDSLTEVYVSNQTVTYTVPAFKSNQSVAEQQLELQKLLVKLNTVQQKNVELNERINRNQSALTSKIVSLNQNGQTHENQLAELRQIQSAYALLVSKSIGNQFENLSMNTLENQEINTVSSPFPSSAWPLQKQTISKVNTTSTTSNIDVSNLITKKDAEVFMTKKEYQSLMNELNSLKKEIKESKNIQVATTAGVGFLGRRKRPRIKNEYTTNYYISGDTSKSDIKTVYIKDTIYIEKPVEKIVYTTVRDTIVNTIEKTNTITNVEEKIEKVTDNKQLLLDQAPETILFDIGQFMIKPMYFKKLIYFAQQIKKYPDLNIQIIGHTDNSGNAEKNLILSNQRANAVKVYLEKRGVSRDHILIKSDGQDNPIAENATKSGKSQNRRVEIKFVR